MSDSIKDGSGAGYSAKVDKTKRLHTSSVNLTTLDSAILDGKAFIFNSGIVSLTTDTESGLLYFENTSSEDLFVELVNFVQGASVAGVGHGTLLGHINPTGGTLIDTQTPTINFNTNTRSTEKFDGPVYAGFEGSTTTGQIGSNVIMTEGAGTELRFAPKAVLPKGGSVTWAYIPPAGNNAAMPVQILVIAYFVGEELK